MVLSTRSVYYAILLIVIMQGNRILFIVMLSVVMLNVIMLNVVMLNVIMLSVLLLNIIMLSIEAPKIGISPKLA